MEKELHFFNEYHTDKVDEVIDSINHLLSEIPSDNSYALLKMSAGSGFHSITGDWKYEDYVKTGLYTSSDTKITKNIGKHKYKSRRIVTDGEKFCLMGFVKISLIDETEYENILKSQKNKHQAIINERDSKRNNAILAKEQEEEERKRKQETYSLLISEAVKAEKLGDYNTAITKAREASSYSSVEKDFLEIIGRCEVYQANAKVEELLNNQQEAINAARVNKVKAGLGALLEEKFPKGTPKVGEFKVTNVKLCLNKVKQWLKAAGLTELSSDQKEHLINTLKRIKENPDKKEVKEWNNKQSKLWVGIAEYLTHEEIISI